MKDAVVRKTSENKNGEVEREKELFIDRILLSPSKAPELRDVI